MDPKDLQTRKLAHLARYRRSDTASPLNVGPMVAAITASGRLPVRAVTIDWAAYDAYVARVDYPTRYPNYTKEFGTGRTGLGKALEHYLSFELLAPKAGDVVMDVASSNSPCADIVLRDYQVARAYRQDLNYPAGVHESKIGSPASAIPLPDASVDAMMLHNSWEHFENDEDLAFLFEARRLLKPGGGMLIIPLFMRDRLEVWTSPAVWEGKYRAVPQTPAFDPRAVIVVREDVKQRQGKFFDAPSLLADLAQVPTDLRFEFVHFVNGAEREQGFPFALLATKQAAAPS